jgi:hypothetical protein
MTIAVPIPRQHSPLAEGLWPRWVDSNPAVEADGRAESTQIRRPLATEADPINASAEGGIAFGPFRLFPTQRLLLEGEKLFSLGVAPLISSSRLLNAWVSSSPRMS